MRTPAPTPEPVPLRILQYNVEKSLDHAMATLLRDPKIMDYAVIAIQEPWVYWYNDVDHALPDGNQGTF